MRWLRDAGLAGGLAALLGAGMALAQDKPPALPGPAQPGGKFAPAPAPTPAPPAGKFAAPPAPRAETPAPPPRADKFAAPVPPPPPAAAPIPPNEPAALGQLRTLLGPGASLTYRSAEPAGPTGAAVRLTGVLLRQPDAQLAAEELMLDQPRPDGIAAATGQGLTLTGKDGTVTAIGRMELRDLTIARPTPGEALRPDQVSVGLLRLETVAVQGARPVAIGELVVEGYAPGQPGRASLSGLDVLVPEAGTLDRVRIGRIALEGIDLAGTLAALTAEKTPPRPPGSYSAVVERVALSLGDQPVGSLAALRMTGALGQGAPDTGRVTLEGLRVEPFPLIADWLQRLGYQALTGDLSAETRFDVAAGRLELVGLLFGIRDAGALGLSFTLEGVTAAAMEARDFQNTGLAGFGLRYLDQSLLRRLAQSLATRTRTERQIRDDWANQAASALGDDGAVAAILGPVQRLLRGQAQEVTLNARPPQPVPVSELPTAAMGGPEAAQRLLGTHGHGAVTRRCLTLPR